jgi:hypothetical protein
LVVASACRDNDITPVRDSGEPPVQTDGGFPDAGPDTGVPNPDPDGGMNQRDGEVITGCNNPPLTAPATGTCEVTTGSNAILMQGNIVVPDGVLENGQVLVDGTGRIACAACDCSGEAAAAGATKIDCADGLITPALINAHDHITFTEAPPAVHSDKYEHRHQWRRGQDGLPSIPGPSNQGGDNGVWWGELRNLMAGAMTINGSGGAGGLLRNIDQPAELQEGLAQPRVRYSTFPLKDSNGARLTSGCNYPDALDDPDSSAIRDSAAYTPHISEGIDQSARNEYLCLSQDTANPDEDVILNKTAVIHGIGLLAADFRDMAASRASLIWSPRSNIDLYGNTAQVTLAKTSGVRIAIGSDWAISGSMNILRELQCAVEFNERNLNTAFNDREILNMATSNAAGSLGADLKIGSLAVGLEADITVWNAKTNPGYRAVLNATPSDVVLVLRSGRAMYGDRTLMSALPETATECETLDVCTVEKTVCARRETGRTIAEMRAQIANNAYDLFFCGAPPNEPTCIPSRPEYSGMPMNGDKDGDGVPDATDNCSDIFNPARPMDGSAQANGDGDALGDVCDPCPTDADRTDCATPDPLDIDGDGVVDTMDNCRGTPNMDQSDRDNDMRGDLCDDCPDEANPGTQGCSATIYDVKRGEVSGRVRLENVLVSSVGPTGFFAQVIPGDANYDLTLGADYSGVFVYVGSAGMKPLAGDRVDIEGNAADFFGQKQVDAATATGGSVTVLTMGNPLPVPVVVTAADVGSDGSGTAGPRAEALEGVFVELGRSEVTDIDPMPDPAESPPLNEYVLDGAVRVDDYFYLTDPFPEVGETFSYVRGVMRFSFNNYKLNPRSVLDIGSTERLTSISPSLLQVPAGLNGVPPGGFAAVLSRPASAPVVVSLMSSSANTTVPATVTIATGAMSADIPLNVAANETGRITITATYNSDTAQAQLIVYDDTAPRTFDSVLVTPQIMPAGSTSGGEVTLNLPGRSPNGTTVTLALSRPGIVTLSAPQLIVPAGATAATFDVIAGAATGTVSLTATVDGTEEVLELEVYIPTSRTPMAGDLVITEIFRNPSGANEKFREWFEVLNVSGVEILIDGMAIEDVVGSHVISAPGVVIPPGSYAVFAYSADPATNGGVQNVTAEYGAADIQLNNGNETIALTFSNATIDTVSYDMAWPGGGQGVSACLRFPYAMDNSVPAAWGNSVGNFGSVATELGSPGAASSATNCP